MPTQKLKIILSDICMTFERQAKLFLNINKLFVILVVSTVTRNTGHFISCYHSDTWMLYSCAGFKGEQSCFSPIQKQQIRSYDCRYDVTKDIAMTSHSFLPDPGNNNGGHMT